MILCHAPVTSDPVIQNTPHHHWPRVQKHAARHILFCWTRNYQSLTFISLEGTVVPSKEYIHITTSMCILISQIHM